MVRWPYGAGIAARCAHVVNPPSPGTSGVITLVLAGTVVPADGTASERNVLYQSAMDINTMDVVPDAAHRTQQRMKHNVTECNTEYNTPASHEIIEGGHEHSMGRFCIHNAHLEIRWKHAHTNHTGKCCNTSTHTSHRKLYHTSTHK